MLDRFTLWACRRVVMPAAYKVEAIRISWLICLFIV